ncbi:MAG TPA: aminotransferase class IV, partial [Membranihabitans sp.]|nr:aminotransferase class IV [Membranihabitans sp.]
DRPGSALYIRPLMIAMDEFLRVSPSETFLFTIMLLPVGPYYGDAVKLWADTEFVRAVPGGTGEAKTAGNYAASLLPSRLAKEKGYDQVLWLDGKEHKYVQEVGTMNIFFVFDDHIATPELDGGILAGITRDSFLTLLHDMDYKVRERPITIEEVMAKGKSGELKEVFGSGTAAVANIVKEIRYKDAVVKFDPARATIAPMLKQTIEDIRHGRVEDKYDWIVRVE